MKERKLSRHAKTMVPKMKTNPNKKQKRKRRNKKLRKLLKAAGMGKHGALYDVGILFQTGRKICGEPKLAAAAELMRDAAAAGDEVLVITIGQKLSGTYQCAHLAAADVGLQVHIVDSEAASQAEALLVREAVRLRDEEGLTAEEIVADVTASNQRIAASTGVTPTLIRCPYGEYDDHVISAIRSMGMEPIQWDVDSLDWKDYDAATITQRVTEKEGPGAIVLFHNAALHTPEALPGILEYLLGQGYSIVPVSQLVLSGEEGTDYTIDHTGRQCPLP